MRSFGRSVVVASLIASGLYLMGCGGSGGSSTPSPFTGAYTGNNGNGTNFEVVISSSGQVSGTDGSGGSITGTISNSGNENMTYTSGNGAIVVRLQGVAALDSAGALIGSGTATINGTPQPYTQDWPRQ